MIEIAICDDVEEDAIKLINYIDDRVFETNCDIFRNAQEFIAEEKDYDVIVLDCVMPDMSGEELAEYLRNKEVKSLLVFYTGMREPSPDIFHLRPFRYLQKDMSPDKLRREMKEILGRCMERKEVHYVYAKDARDIVKIAVHTISYIELAKHGCYIHVMQEEGEHVYTVRESLREMKERLGASGFAQSHNSYLVNMEHVAGYQKTYIQMVEGIELSVSRAYRKKFEMAFRRFILGRR